MTINDNIWNNMKENHFDIIGDVHGHASLLKKLLAEMGYSKSNGVWKHPERTAVFIGDFINRGPEIREALQIIYTMATEGSALSILGNHEYSAILYHIKDSRGDFLSKHISVNRGQIQTTLTAFKNFKEEWKDYLQWFRQLPFFLDLGKIRVAHAYWNDEDMKYLSAFIPEGKLKKPFLRSIHEEKHPAAAIIYKTLKGLEFQCPPDLIVKCDSGISRTIFRMNWWESPEKKTFRNLAFGNKFVLPDYTVPPEIAPSFEPYGPEKPNIIVGHYCLSEGPRILQSNICCIDGCVAGNQRLSAYRFNGEEILTSENIFTVSL
jgi:hypothetical protein